MERVTTARWQSLCKVDCLANFDVLRWQGLLSRLEPHGRDQK
jgi:hypothetical protein